MNDANHSLVFIDSNIWLYAILPKQDLVKEHTANALIQKSESSIAISTQVVNEVVNNMIRKGQFDEPSIRSFIASVYHQYRVINVSQLVQEKASFLRENHSLSHWDSLVIAAALQAGASILYTEDMQNGQVIANQLTIVNLFI